MPRRAIEWVLMLLVLTAGSPLAAQTVRTGSITGTVVDPSGARLTYDGLKRAPHPAIGNDDFKLQLTDVLVTIIELWGASTWTKR